MVVDVEIKNRAKKLLITLLIILAISMILTVVNNIFYLVTIFIASVLFIVSYTYFFEVVLKKHYGLGTVFVILGTAGVLTSIITNKYDFGTVFMIFSIMLGFLLDLIL